MPEFAKDTSLQNSGTKMNSAEKSISPPKNQQYQHLCLDYIMIAKNDAYDKNKPMIEQYLDVPRRNPQLYTENADKILIPSTHWPSDHFSLVYTIRLACPPGTRQLIVDGSKINYKPKLSVGLQDDEVQVFLK